MGAGTSNVAKNGVNYSTYIDDSGLPMCWALMIPLCFMLGGKSKRPKNLAKINTSANEVILNFINKLPKKTKKLNPYILYLQPTSPLRNYNHLNKAFKLLEKSKKHNLVSICKSEKSLLKSLVIKNKNLSVLFPKYYNANDQKLPSLYRQNGAIYIFLLKNFLKQNKIPINNLMPFIMNKKDSIDVNNIEDLKKINKIK